MSTNYEHQSNEVIAKELLIALIEKNCINVSKDQPYAVAIGEMYQTILKHLNQKPE